MKKHIIITDDDAGIRDMTRLILERAGHRVTVYSNGESLLESEPDHPDIFILDKHLPGMDGLEICRVLKSRDVTRHVPVIMLSANPHIGELAKEAGADDFLEKPFNLKQFRDMVNRYAG